MKVGFACWLGGSLYFATYLTNLLTPPSQNLDKNIVKYSHDRHPSHQFE